MIFCFFKVKNIVLPTQDYKFKYKIHVSLIVLHINYPFPNQHIYLL